jgi:hypothetical protein
VRLDLVSFAPGTPYGRRCLVLFGVAGLGVVAFVLAIVSGERGGETFTSNWWLTGPALVAAFGLIGTFVAGVVAVFREHERSVTVFVATAVGALATLYLAAEIAFPH